jgi:hypothetical protein
VRARGWFVTGVRSNRAHDLLGAAAGTCNPAYGQGPVLVHRVQHAPGMGGDQRAQHAKTGGTGSHDGSPEAMALGQLQVATATINQLLTHWIPVLGQAASERRAVGARELVEAQHAVTRLDVALAQAVGMIAIAGGSPALNVQYAVAEAQRDVLRAQMLRLLAMQHDLHAKPQTAGGGGGGAPNAPPPTAPPGGSRASVAPGGTVLPRAAPTGTKDAFVKGAKSEYQPTWADIAAAAGGDATALARLDVAWIDNLNDVFLDSIDGQFSKEASRAAFIKSVRNDADVAKLWKEQKQELDQLKADARKRLADAGKASTAKAIAGDADYTKAKAALNKEQAEEFGELTADRQDAFDAQKHKVRHAEDAVAPPAAGVTREEGRLLARVNFMAWGEDVLGTTAAVKRHFQGMKEVAGFGGLWLCGPAAIRLAQAKDWFEQQYPGNTFFQTTVGWSMRGVHHENHKLTYLGHALGLSIDFRAYENPSFLKDGPGMFMLRRFGGGTAGGKPQTGHSRMNMPDDTFKAIIAMGQASEAGEDVSARGKEILDTAMKEYDKMTTTSDNLRTSIGVPLAELRETEKAWIELNGPLKGSIEAAEKKLVAAKAKAQKDVAKQAAEDPQLDHDAALAADPGVVAATKARDDAVAAVEAAKTTVKTGLDKAFAPWVKGLEADIAEHRKVAGGGAGVALDVKAAKNLKSRVDGAKKLGDLQVILKDKKLGGVFDDALDSITDFATLKAEMSKRATAVADAKNADGEIRVREELLRRVHDGAAVFGKVAYSEKTNRWDTKLEVDGPPIMQLLELGFARHDELAAPDHKGKQEVFNREFIAAMMRFGFNTGADWGAIDTMHFDFLEAFKEIAGGMDWYKEDYGPKP